MSEIPNFPSDNAQNGQLAKGVLTDAWATSVDTLNANHLAGLAQVRQARVNQLVRKAAVLTAQYGAADAGVVKAQASVSAEKSVAAVLGVTRDIAMTAVPQPAANGWAVQGRVRDKDLKPLAKLSVCLVDQQNAWLREYGYAYTDDTGYFVLNGAADNTQGAYLEVLDQNGLPLLIDSTSLGLGSGTVQYLDLVLPSLQPLGNPPPGAASFQGASK